MNTRIMVFAGIFLVACAAPQRPAVLAEAPGIVWPPAPEKARIRFEQEIGSPADLDIRPSGFRRFMDAVAGKKDTGMIRPYAVAVHDEKILIGDPGLHAVHLLDTRDRRAVTVFAAGNEALSSPVGVALGENRLFIADSALGRVFILDGKQELVSTIDTLQRPTSLAYDPGSRRLYVADTLGHMIVVFDDSGQRVNEIGERGAGEGQFNFPSHIFLSDGKLLVNDNMNFRIQSFDMEGRFLYSFGTHGDGSGSFSQPKGVAADSNGNIYVAGATIDRVQVFSQRGEFLLAFGSKGANKGEFLMPAGIYIKDDSIFVADSLNRRIQVFSYVGED